ncbi:hypothetical protein IT417_03820 [bacterium]|nr:hypothetical protein [bacterium]
MKKFWEYIKTKGILFATWYGISNPFGGDAFTTLDGTVERLTFLINTAIAFSALVTVALYVYGGYKIIISAQGEADHLVEGQNTIKAATIGMLIVFLAGTIIKFVVEQVLR